MQRTDGRFLGIDRGLLGDVILVVVLYLMYSPTFLSDYLMNDELANIGTGHLNLYRSARGAFFISGRALAGIFQALTFHLVDYDPARVQLVRFLAFTSVALIAVVLRRFLTDRSGSHAFGLLVVLFLFTQLPVQGLMGYSLQLAASTSTSLWMSLLAFYTQFSHWTSRRFSRSLRGGIVFVLLMLAMQSAQVWAFFALIPMSYLALKDWAKHKPQIVAFLCLAVLALGISTVVYAIGLGYWHESGRQGYRLGEQWMQALGGKPLEVLLTAINPLTYWSAFKPWGYPFPFSWTPRLGALKQTIATAILCAWALLILVTVGLELWRSQPGERAQLAFKWLSVLLCLGLGGAFLVADSPTAAADHRPHMVLVFAGVAIIAAAYCLEVLESQLWWLSSRPARWAVLVLVIGSCFGAQANVFRGMVANHVAQLTFMRTELMRERPVKRLVVVLPDWRGCLAEPCDPWMGQVVSSQWHISRPGGYRYALATVGEDPETDITFVERRHRELPEDATLIDWNTFVAGRRAEVRVRR